MIRLKGNINQISFLLRHAKYWFGGKKLSEVSKSEWEQFLALFTYRAN